MTSYESPRDSKTVKAEGVRLRQEVEGIAKVCHPARSVPITRFSGKNQVEQAKFPFKT